MQNTYRFVIMNGETFEEVSSYRLTLLNVWVLISTVVVVVSALVVCLIVFTPLKRYIPGYSTENYAEKVYTLNKQIVELQKELSAQQVYTERVRKILVGDYSSEEEAISKDEAAAAAAELDQGQLNTVDPELDEVEPIEVDRQLREEVEFQEIGQQAQIPNTTTNFSPRNLPLERMIFNPPVRGAISAGFLVNDEHYGVDILAPKNTAIKATRAGYIFFAGWTVETGNTIAIQHDNNVISVYKHNSAILKKVGEFVEAGEAVAIIGNTGTLSDGPHLHFELWHEGTPVDPTIYMSF